MSSVLQCDKCGQIIKIPYSAMKVRMTLNIGTDRDLVIHADICQSCEGFVATRRGYNPTFAERQQAFEAALKRAVVQQLTSKGVTDDRQAGH